MNLRCINDGWSLALIRLFTRLLQFRFSLLRRVPLVVLGEFLVPLIVQAGTAPDKPVGAAEYSSQVVREVGGHRFVWVFTCDGADCLVGKFVGGDYWIAPKKPGEQIVLQSVVPGGGEHGLEINPVSATKQGFLSCQQHSYDSKLNLMTSLPLNVRVNSSLVKARKRNASCGTKVTEGCCVDSYDVLTVLAAPPADNGRSAFRPGFAGEEKLIYYLDQFDFTVIPTLKAISFKYRIDFKQIHARWHAPYVDHYMYKIGDAGRAFAPMAVIPDYGATQAASYLGDLLSVMGDTPLESKMPGLTGLLQRGIDLHASWKQGINWPSGAGQQMGRKPPIAFFATLIKDEKIKHDVIRMSENNRNETQEDGQVRLIDQIAGGGGIPVWGDSGGQCGEDNYWAQLFAAQHYDGGSGIPIRGGDNMRTCGDPYGWIDGPAGTPGSEYMACCSTGGFIAYSLAQNLMPALCRVANDNDLNVYVNRVVRNGLHTKPDPCAPPDARESKECRPYAKGAPNCLYYRNTWGPDPHRLGMCIRNGTNGTQQFGRFPHLHGKTLEKIHNEPEISRHLRTLFGATVFDKCAKIKNPKGDVLGRLW